MRATDPGLFTYSLLKHEVDAHLNPPQHTAGRGPRLHTGQPTCFDLSSALGPLGLRPISSGTTHNLFVSTLCPLSTSAREQCTVQKHTCTRACARTRTHTQNKKRKTKRHTQTLYRPHANTVCHTKPCSASVPLPLCLLDSFRLSPPLRLFCLLQERPSAQLYTGEYPHLVDDLHSNQGGNVHCLSVRRSVRVRALICLIYTTADESCYRTDCSESHGYIRVAV